MERASRLCPRANCPLHEDIEHSLVVTYNGKAFDLPVIRQELGIPLDQRILIWYR